MKRLFLCSSFADVADLLPGFAGNERGGGDFYPNCGAPRGV